MAEPITVTIQGLNSPIATVKVQNKLSESAVTSVAGRVGDILLTNADVAGVENVNNTSDLDKPISTATQAALDLKPNSGDFASTIHQHTLADITDAGSAAAADVGDFATSSHQHLLSDISGIGTAAASDTGDFAPYIHTHLMSDVTDLATGAISLSNKDLTDYTNIIHADQIHLRVKADVNLSKGQPVKFDSYNIGENAINVSLADQSTNISIGLAEENISQGNFGNIITAGILDHVNTSDFNEGEILYVNGEGLLTGVEPLSGYSQPIAFCLKSQQNNGALQVLAAYPKQPSSDVRNDSNVSGLTVTDALNNLEAANTGSYATIEQGALADSAIQPEDINTLTGLNSIVADATILSSGQIAANYQPLDSILTNTTASFTTSYESKLSSIASGAEVNVNADWNAVGGDAEILNKPAFGDITGSNISDFATSAQGALADSALQSGDNISLLNNDAGYLTGISFNSGDYQLKSEKGVAGGYASLDGGGKIPSAQLPTYVDDVLEYPTLSNFPTFGTFGKIYVALDTNKIYRWSGSTYVELANGTEYVTSVNSLTGVVVLDPDDLNDSVTTNKFTTQADIDKLSGIASGAEVNVNADWTATSGDAEILNKPAFGSMTGANIGDYSPTGHQHVLADITDAGTMAASDTGSYTLTGHTHPTSDVIGLGTIATYNSGDYSQTGHNHQLSDIIDAGTSASYDVPSFGDAGLTQVVLGSDSRLDWANVIGSAAYLDFNSTGDASSFQAVRGNDSRLSLASSSLQSGDNVSLLTNDTGYLTSETNKNWYITKLGDETTDTSVGIKTTWMVPASGKIHNVAAGCSTVVSGSAITLDVKSNGTGIFSTKPTIDDLEQTTATAATGSVLSTSPTAVAPGDKITFEVDTFGGVGGAGLHIDLLISWD